MRPALDGFFAYDDNGDAYLIGGKFKNTDSYFFPKHLGGTDPDVGANAEIEEVALSRYGTLWSYTTSHYQPPEPFIAATDTFEPITIAAVKLEHEKMVVLGQCPAGITPDDLHIGMRMELIIDKLYSDEDGDYSVWMWMPA